MDTYKQRLLDLFTTAYEGGSSYWARLNIRFSDEVLQKIKSDGISISEYLFKRMFDDNREYRVWDVENGELLGTISKDNLKKGYKLMKDDHEKHFDNVLTGDWDVWTADVFLQLAVMQEIVYG